MESGTEAPAGPGGPAETTDPIAAPLPDADRLRRWWARREHGARWAAAAVAVCTAGNVALAVHDLSRSLWTDEGASWLIAVQHGHMFWTSVFHEGGDMLLYYLLLHVVVMIFGTSPTALRMPSVLYGAAAIPVVYALGRRCLGSRWAGVACAATMAVTLPLVFWQQNARAYSLDTTLAAATTLAWVLAVRDRRRAPMVLWVVLTVAAIYSHPLAVLVVLAQLPLVVLARPDRALLLRLVAALAGVAVLCIPFALIAVHRGTDQIDWLNKPRVHSIRSVTDFLAGGTAGLVTHDHVAVVYGAFVAWGLGVLGIVVVAIRRRSARLSFGPVLVLSGLVVPPVAAYVASLVVQPIFLSRYMIVALPAGVVLAVAGVRTLWYRPVMVAGLAALVAGRLLISVPAYPMSIELDEQAALLVAGHTQARDCVAFFVNSERVTYDYYLRRDGDPGPRQVLPHTFRGTTVSATMPLARLKALDDLSYARTLPFYTSARLDALTACRRLWLVRGHYGNLAVPATRGEHLRFSALLVQLRGDFAHTTFMHDGVLLFSGNLHEPKPKPEPGPTPKPGHRHHGHRRDVHRHHGRRRDVHRHHRRRAIVTGVRRPPAPPAA